MRDIKQVATFKKDLKRVAKRNKNLNKLFAIVEILALGKSLPIKYRPHKLVGNYSPKSECHIEPDWLLIYEVDNNSVILYRTGSHADLFE